MRNKFLRAQFHDRLDTLCNSDDTIANFLLRNRLCTSERILELRQKPNRDQEMVVFLEGLEDKFSFIDYEWQVLPQERMRLLIITENDKLEISWPS